MRDGAMAMAMAMAAAHIFFFVSCHTFTAMPYAN
jgi:hypothetical protein